MLFIAYCQIDRILSEYCIYSCLCILSFNSQMLFAIYAEFCRFLISDTLQEFLTYFHITFTSNMMSLNVWVDNRIVDNYPSKTKLSHGLIGLRKLRKDEWDVGYLYKYKLLSLLSPLHIQEVAVAPCKYISHQLVEWLNNHLIKSTVAAWSLNIPHYILNSARNK